jgi:hypothetical protein
LYSALCLQNAGAAFCEIARHDANAASWTHAVENAAAETEHGEIPSAARQALLAFETECLGLALRDGWVRSIGDTETLDWESARPNANAILRRAGLPELDSAEFPIDERASLGSGAATVVLCAGRRSGYALVVPPGAPIREAVAVELPGYSARLADNLTMSRRDGWVPALLAWRSGRNVAAFEAALRRISIRMWESVIGPVDEALTTLGCNRKVDLVVRGDQRLLPWACASSHTDMRQIYAEQTELGTGFDLSTLLLGKSRKTRQRCPDIERHSGMALRSRLLLFAPLLGIFLEEAIEIPSRAGQVLRLLSITDGTGDLPMTRLEGYAGRDSFPDSNIHLEGGLHPLSAPFLYELMEAASILHVACHGVWMPTNPWTSGLMLGPEYALYAASVRARIRLNGSLVLLSACESGIGVPSAAGEGNLLQAFLLAGAACVVPSYWMVNDLSSLLFANALFSKLRQGAGVFESVEFARKSLRTMTVDQLWTAIEPLVARRPSVRQTVARSVEQATRDQELPFVSPVHWGAQFIAAVNR